MSPAFCLWLFSVCLVPRALVAVGSYPGGHVHGVDPRIMDEDYTEGAVGEEEEETRLNQFRRDVEHIREHMEGRIDVNSINTEGASKTELDWHFFNIHDTNDDMKLDGLELLQAMGHALHHQVEEMQKQGLKSGQLEHRMKRANNHFIRRIDRLLENEDLNGDGYINYVEYAKARSTKMLLKQADTIQKEPTSNWL